MRHLRLPGPSHSGWFALLLMGGLAGAWIAHTFAGLGLRPQGWWPWLLALVIAPGLEEWALRAVLLPTLADKLARWAPPDQATVHAQWLANGLISALFVLLHQGTAGTMAWLWFFPSWVLGMVWFKFKSWGVCALTHAWFNAALIVVSLGLPALAQAQAHNPPPTNAPELALPAIECAMPSTPLVSTEHTWSGQTLQATVHAAADRLVLTVLAQAPSGQASGAPQIHTCLHNTQLLGAVGAMLPTLRFDQSHLVLTWHAAAVAEHPRAELYQFILDAAQVAWPLVRYRHELGLGRGRSGVDARLDQHEAKWLQADRPPLHGKLLMQPPIALVNLPHYQAFAPQPLVDKVYRPGQP